jgi:hypothetical protein
MAISGIQTIGIGLQNESTGSDSLYTAFTKVNTNFNTLFGCASPFNTFTAGNGVGISSNANSGIVTITNTGVRSLIAGTNIVLSSSNGDVTISAGGGNSNNSGTVTSVGLIPISNTRLTVNNSPIVSSGSFSIDLANSGVAPGTYTYPTVTVDTYGRITNISNANAAGTVTSVVVSGGAGIQVTGSPITTTGNISIINTGVTRISAGTGVAVTGSNGNVTISVANLGGTVTSVGVSSNALVVVGTPVTSAGIISIDLPSNITASRFISTVASGTAPFVVSSNTVVTNLNADLLDGYTTSSAATANTIVLRDANANITANNISGTLITAAQGNITTVGILTALGVNNTITASAFTANTGVFTGNGSGLTAIAGANVTGTVANATSAGSATTAGTVTTNAQPNITSIGTLANLSVTGNANVSGNLNLTTGNIIYTPRYGSFYSNTTQSNPVVNTAMAMTFNNSTNANGVSVVSNSRLTVAKAGVYNIQFSAQLTKTDAGSDYLEIWLSKNGSAVAWTNTLFKLDGSNTYQLASLNFVETLNASEYVQLMWGSADLNAKLIAINSANTIMGVDVPSVIVTVTPVGA